MSTPDIEQAIEALVDQPGGLRAVLEALSAVCDAKAEHIRTTWQDHTSADWWTNASYWIDHAVDMAHDPAGAGVTQPGKNPPMK